MAYATHSPPFDFTSHPPSHEVRNPLLGVFLKMAYNSKVRVKINMRYDSGEYGIEVYDPKTKLNIESHGTSMDSIINEICQDEQWRKILGA